MLRLTPLAVLLAFAAWGGLTILAQSKPAVPPQGGTVLSVYTAGQATTPQMPLWKALADGELDFTPELHLWKNLDDLRGLLLAGKGDIWIGHMDGLAQAAMRGAPVRLLAVTGWRKFYFLSSRPDVHTFEDLIRLPQGTAVASAPPRSLAVPILRALESRGGPKLAYEPFELKQLVLAALHGDKDLLLLPEPLVSILLHRQPKLRVVAGVEEEYGRITGKEPVLPLAGIAANIETLEQNPDLEERLCLALLDQEAELMADPESGLAAMPQELARFVAPERVRESFERDVIRVRTAVESKQMIESYLGLILPEGQKTPPESFYGCSR